MTRMRDKLDVGQCISVIMFIIGWSIDFQDLISTFLTKNVALNVCIHVNERLYHVFV